ncbi:hypothetical protein ACQZV8_00785 [Magnetococcales bacterium HHB-1]
MRGQNIQDKENYDLRFEVIKPGFTQDDDKIYALAFTFLHQYLSQGGRWPQAKEALKVDDLELKKIILDDFIKVQIAEQHFQQKIPLKKIAKTLGVPVKALLEARKSMIEEVKEAAIDAYHLTKERQEEAER